MSQMLRKWKWPPKDCTNKKSSSRGCILRERFGATRNRLTRRTPISTVLSMRSKTRRQLRIRTVGYLKTTISSSILTVSQK